MSVKLISADEKLKIEISGSTFYYRRVRPIEKNNIIRECTKRGEIDWSTASLKMSELCILGWKNVTDLEGNEIAFDPTLISSLPEEVLIAIQDKVGAADVDGGVEKNSKAAPKS